MVESSQTLPQVRVVKPEASTPRFTRPHNASSPTSGLWLFTPWNIAHIAAPTIWPSAYSPWFRLWCSGNASCLNPEGPSGLPRKARPGGNASVS